MNGVPSIEHRRKSKPWLDLSALSEIDQISVPASSISRRDRSKARQLCRRRPADRTSGDPSGSGRTSENASTRVASFSPMIASRSPLVAFSVMT